MSHMVIFKQVLEMIETPMKKIRGITESGDYAEVRLKGNSLDVRASKELGDDMRIIFMDTVDENLSLADIIILLEIKFIKEEIDASKENSSN